MIGSGIVGLIVSYQLLQAGADVVAVIEAATEIGGYGVHASKIRRAGVPIHTSHTILEAIGTDCVENAIIAQINDTWRPIEGSEKTLNVDTICIAVGLAPLTELAHLCGCEFKYIPELGGHVPKHNFNMETTVKGLYVAGDITGVEEASTAMEEGKLAGIACAESLGSYQKNVADKLKSEVWTRLSALRTGPFGESRKESKSRIVDNTYGCM
jgi:pyruvate/2-oxoglutarate dehydrogenase complex dihydrolipoamide dehydrogenase (E3) component